jgi:hypothetical protein
MSYLKLRIRSNNLDLTRIILSAFDRSILIYYLTPIYAAAAINEEDINKLETQIIKEQFGLRGDETNEKIQKVMSFYSISTASVISKHGSELIK